jgi:hypothetical protein
MSSCACTPLHQLLQKPLTDHYLTFFYRYLTPNGCPAPQPPLAGACGALGAGTAPGALNR